MKNTIFTGDARTEALKVIEATRDFPFETEAGIDQLTEAIEQVGIRSSLLAPYARDLATSKMQDDGEELVMSRKHALGFHVLFALEGKSYQQFKRAHRDDIHEVGQDEEGTVSRDAVRAALRHH